MRTRDVPPELAEVRDLVAIPIWHDTKPNAAAVLGISRNHAYELAARGEIPTVHLGRRRVVQVAALLKMLGADE